jgi:HPt (histidine-containing phosphotransfer) domain-containing protein
MPRAADHPVTAKDETVILSRRFEELIPGFIENRRKELEELRGALDAGRYEQLAQLGHRMRGIGSTYGFDRVSVVGSTYGFDRVSVVGGQIEERAAVSDRAGLAACLAEYAEYLARVKVVYE